MTGTVKFRVIGDRADIRTVIGLLDPVLDIVEDWRLYPQRTGDKIMAYMEARPRTTAASNPTATTPAEQGDG